MACENRTWLHKLCNHYQVIDVLKCRDHISDPNDRICPPPREDVHDPRDRSDTFCPVCTGETPPDSDMAKIRHCKKHGWSGTPSKGQEVSKSSSLG